MEYEKITDLILLDLPGAFDTVDHKNTHSPPRKMFRSIWPRSHELDRI